MTEAYRSIEARDPACRLVLTCEHASARVPAPLRATAADRDWLATHWGHDLGAADVVERLARLLGAPALLACFSRLVCDANRPPDHPDLIRTEVEGHGLSFNAGLTAAERDRRLHTYHAPYHAALAELVHARRQAVGEPLLLSVHSFTPQLGEDRRDMHVGVLFDDHEDLAEVLARALAAQGRKTALNAPYSGREGLIYAASRHGRAQSVAYLELELRQDLLVEDRDRQRWAASICAALEQAFGLGTAASGR